MIPATNATSEKTFFKIEAYQDLSSFNYDSKKTQSTYDTYVCAIYNENLDAMKKTTRQKEKYTQSGLIRNEGKSLVHCLFFGGPILLIFSTLTSGDAYFFYFLDSHCLIF